MFCKYCGNRLDDGDRFCGACGHPVDEKPVQEAAPEKVYKKQTLAEISRGFSEGKKTVFKTYGVFGTQKGVFGLKAREKTRTLGLLAPSFYT